MAGEDEAFFEIANQLVVDEANEYLDDRLKRVEAWVKHRTSQNQPADLRSLIEQIMREPNDRGPVIVALSAALWRIREMEKADAERRST